MKRFIMIVIGLGLGVTACAGDAAEDTVEYELMTDTIAIPADSAVSDSVAETVVPNSDPMSAPRPLSRVPIRVTPTPRVPPVQIARAVFGIAEIAIDSARFTPADYLRVLLRGDQSFETLTSSGGEFYFEDVPAGKYQLVFLTATKDARQVYARDVIITAEPKQRLGAIHIPFDSIRSRFRQAS